MYKLLCIVILGSLIGGCAPGATFRQAGVTDSQRDRDYFDCQLQAGAAAHGDPFKEPLYIVKCMRMKGYN